MSEEAECVRERLDGGRGRAHAETAHQREHAEGLAARQLTEQGVELRTVACKEHIDVEVFDRVICMVRDLRKKDRLVN